MAATNPGSPGAIVSGLKKPLLKIDGESGSDAEAIIERYDDRLSDSATSWLQTVVEFGADYEINSFQISDFSVRDADGSRTTLTLNVSEETKDDFIENDLIALFGDDARLISITYNAQDGGYDIVIADSYTWQIDPRSNNTINGTAYDDVLNGGFGNDTINGWTGNDVLNGGAGRDELNGEADNDTLNGNEGNDVLNGGEGDDTLNGDGGDDILNGDEGDDALNGGDGNDILNGGGGLDAYSGGAGNDTFNLVDLSFAGVDGGSGDDTLVLSSAGSLLNLAGGDLKIVDIELVDLSGSEANELLLDQPAVLAAASSDDTGTHVLTVDGNTDDTLRLIDVQWAFAGTVNTNGTRYDRYVSGDAELRIDQDVAVQFPNRIELANLKPHQGFVILGPEGGARAGWSVSSAGDVNGDGYADFVVGAHSGASTTWAGQAYVVFGDSDGVGVRGVDGRQVVDLSTFEAQQGFVILGDLAGDEVGFSVSSAGDVNGDGFDDIVVGAWRNDDGGNNAGAAYVVFGSDGRFGQTIGGNQVVDLSQLTASEGFVIQGDMADDEAGSSVSSVGDINGDGLDDLIVGAPRGDDGGNLAGEAYVIFGSMTGHGTPDAAGRSIVDLTTLNTSQGFVIQGEAAINQAGFSVSSAGDINNDGFDDFIVGAPTASDGVDQFGSPNRNGAAFVVFGTNTGFGTADNANGYDRYVVDLAVLAPDEGFVIYGDNWDDEAGFSISAAGDVNGDGFDDIIIGAPEAWSYGAGEAYVVFGGDDGFGSLDANGRGVIDLTTLTPTQGFVIRGYSSVTEPSIALSAGFSVSAAGDFNGDGFDDIVVGAPTSDFGGSDAGEAFVIFGSGLGFGVEDYSGTGRQVVYLEDLALPDGFALSGDSDADRVGNSVSGAGDVNGDGFDDLIVGAPQGTYTGTSYDEPGAAYVVYGGAFGASDSPIVLKGSTSAEILIGGIGDDTLIGRGGADVMRSGAGDDTLVVTDLTFQKADGGTGVDTLVLDGANANFDFSTIADNKIESIEAINFAGSGDNTLTLGHSVTLNLSEVPHFDFTGIVPAPKALVIEGDEGDTLNLLAADQGEWRLQATDVDLAGTAGGAYDVYSFGADGSHLIKLAVNEAVDVLLL